MEMEPSSLSEFDFHLQAPRFEEGGSTGGRKRKSCPASEYFEFGPDRFKAVPVDKLFVLEVFAGSARLTTAMNAAGLRGLAYDKT